eukprot:11939413-Karenia_brevis.AAC.1
MDLYKKNTSEVYGVLVSLSGWEAKGILKKIDDPGGGADGYKALSIFSRRFDVKAAAGLLQTCLGV